MKFGPRLPFCEQPKRQSSLQRPAGGFPASRDCHPTPFPSVGYALLRATAHQQPLHFQSLAHSFRHDARGGVSFPSTFNLRPLISILASVAQNAAASFLPCRTCKNKGLKTLVSATHPKKGGVPRKLLTSFVPAHPTSRTLVSSWLSAPSFFILLGSCAI